MLLSVSHEFLPKRPSVHTARVMDHFGINFETGQHVIADALDIPVAAGDIVCFTGPSGSGKSSLMRAVASALSPPLILGGAGGVARSTPSHDGQTPPTPPRIRGGVVNIDLLELPDVPLIDALGLPFDESLRLLSSCGLGEAQLLLRTPRELSDGQRYRFRLAAALARQPAWVVADEFTATLDRTLAKVIAFNVHRLTRGDKQPCLSAADVPTGFLLATTHEDILADLEPTVHVRCRLDGRIDIARISPPSEGGGGDSPP